MSKNKKSEIPRHSFEGYHNSDLERSINRLQKAGTYRDLSTVCVIPIPGDPARPGTSMIPLKSYLAWSDMMKPMNQKFFQMPVEGMEVGAAYNHAVETILGHPELSKWKYMLTLEWDNLPPPDGLLKLYESMDKFDVVAGLYWTKGEGGQPMCYGDPKVMPKNFIPQIPPADSVQEYNGLGMGFNLFKLDIFRKMPGPWFRTIQDYTPNVGVKMFTQDLWFYQNAAKYGYRFACDSRVKVGHLDPNTGMVW